LCGIERLSPAGNLVEAPPAPSRHPVSGNAGTALSRRCRIEMKAHIENLEKTQILH